MNNLEHQFYQLLKQLLRFRVLIFIGLLVVVYGFIIWRVNGLADPPPAQNATSQAATAGPRIDQATVDKIKQLQDNSVNVKSLFDQARHNPFQE
jgi:hypothetical protein